MPKTVVTIELESKNISTLHDLVGDLLDLCRDYKEAEVYYEFKHKDIVDKPPLKFLVHYMVNEQVEDSVIIEGETLAEVRDNTSEFLISRGIKFRYLYSEELKLCKEGELPCLK